MRKSLRNIALACAATAAVTLAMATSAFASNTMTADTDFTYSKDAGTVTLTSTFLAGLSDQTTILIYDDTAADPANLGSNDILYINQDDAGTTATFTGMGLKGGLVEGRTYTIKVGGKNIAEDGIYVGTFAITSEGRVIQLGDCDGIKGIDGGDVNAIFGDILKTTPLTGDNLIAGDCDGIKGIDGGDVNAVFADILGTSKLGTVTVK